VVKTREKGATAINYKALVDKRLVEGVFKTQTRQLQDGSSGVINLIVLIFLIGWERSWSHRGHMSNRKMGKRVRRSKSRSHSRDRSSRKMRNRERRSRSRSHSRDRSCTTM